MNSSIKTMVGLLILGVIVGFAVFSAEAYADDDRVICATNSQDQESPAFIERVNDPFGAEPAESEKGQINNNHRASENKSFSDMDDSSKSIKKYDTVVRVDGTEVSKEADQFKEGIQQTSDGIRYYEKDGSYAIDEWKEIEGNKYYFNSDGYAVTYEQIINDNHYYFSASGVMRTGWVTWNSDNTKSYFGSDGVALSGWQTLDGKRYYFDPDNKDRSARWETVIEGERYYFGSDCSMVSGLVTWKKDGTCSYFDPNSNDGKAKALFGWQEIEGDWYYFDKADSYRSLLWLQEIGGNKYYFNKDSKRVSGIVTWNSDKTKSYFNEDGVMSSGWAEWKGNRYYIDPNTMRAVKYLQTISGNKYYFDSECEMYTGWLKWNADGKYSYFKPNGMMVFGTYTIDGVKFNFGTSGKVNSMDPVRTDMINKAQKYSSGTKYLILVDLSGHKVGVFKGKKNNWSLQYYWSCAVGKSSTPTIKGTYRTTGFTRPYLTTDSRAIYCTQIWGGYFFHSILSSENELGKNVSHGCIRLPYSAANWIYKNINSGTTVYIYK